jgi:hypothetical protein
MAFLFFGRFSGQILLNYLPDFIAGERSIVTNGLDPSFVRIKIKPIEKPGVFPCDAARVRR